MCLGSCLPLVKRAGASYVCFILLSPAPTRKDASSTMLGSKTLYLARHAQTVFNRSGRLQGNDAHTPLTATGMQQALAMAQHLKGVLGVKPDLHFWCSPAGRTRQTATAIADALEVDYFQITFDDRLKEIEVGDWTGRLYRDVAAEVGPVIDPARRVFIQKPPGGEWYGDMIARLTGWARDVANHPSQTHLAISHGLASRVLRGALHQRDWQDDIGAMIAPDIPQGSLVCLENGGEETLSPGGPHSKEFGF